MRIKLTDGNIVYKGMYCNSLDDKGHYQVGDKIKYWVAFDELKNQPAPDGSMNYSQITLKMITQREQLCLSWLT